MIRSIPIDVFQERAPLTIHQALCVYLCDDPDGPNLTHLEAAEVLGFNHRSEVSTHLRRAREHLD